MNFETVLFYKQQQQQTNEVGGTANRSQTDTNPPSRAGLVSPSEIWNVLKMRIM
jgi:hypothetical protein